MIEQKAQNHFILSKKQMNVTNKLSLFYPLNTVIGEVNNERILNQTTEKSSDLRYTQHFNDWFTHT